MHGSCFVILLFVAKEEFQKQNSWKQEKRLPSGAINYGGHWTPDASRTFHVLLSRANVRSNN